MRILLITPPQSKNIQASIPDIFYDLRGMHPPIGLLYLESFLSKKTSSHTVEIYDIYAEEDSEEEAVKKINEFDPDLVGIQMLTLSAPNTLSILSKVKSLNPNIITVVGGSHPTLYPKKTAALKEVDYAVLGEGEVPFYKLVKNLEAGNNNPKIKGLSYKFNDELYLNRGSNSLKDLDEVPLIDRRLLNINNYQSSFSGERKITSIVTSRGCPYNCVFCAKFENNFRAHSPEYVVEDIKNSLEMGIEEIFVVDDTFSLNIERAKEICRLVISQELEFSWYINTRVNTVDEELLGLLKEAGCKQVNYGIESGSQRIIENLNKGIDLKKAEEVIKKTKDAGIDALCYFMIGTPGETIEDIEKTKNFIKRAKPDFVRFSVTTLEPCTELYQMALREGVVDEDVWSNFAENPREDFHVPVWDKNFSEEELNDMLVSLSKEHYIKPKFILKNLMKIRGWKDFKNGLRSFFKIMKM